MARFSLPLWSLCSVLALGTGYGCSSSSKSNSDGSGGSGGDVGAAGMGNGGGGNGGTDASAGTDAGGAGGSSAGTGGGGSGGAGGSGGMGSAEFQTVHVFQTSRNAGDGGTPEHCDALADLTPHDAGDAASTVIAVDLEQPRQTIIGFGAAITEATASTIAILPEDKQNEIYDAYFSPDGSGYALTRTHVGSCDFSLAEYTYDDTPGDATLADFSIAYDQTYLIPALKKAIAAAGGDLKVLASPWSAPAWMKSNTSLYDGTLLPEAYDVFAAYLSKYIQAYEAQGVPIWALTPTNEPLGVGGARESMVWTPAGMNTFLRDSLGPQFETDGVDVDVFIFDHNKETTTSDAVTWAQTIFGDAATADVATGTAVHWYDSTFEVFDTELDAIHDVAPDKPILFDEGTADGFLFNRSPAEINAAPWFDNDEWFWTKENYDWGYVYADKAVHPAYASVHRYARDIIVGLNHWYSGWIDWNAVLNKFGAMDAASGGIGNFGDPGVSHIPNGVPAGILIDEATPSAPIIYYTPVFYTLRQFSKFIRPGATIATTTLTLGPDVTATGYDDQPTLDGRALMAVGAQNEDGTVAVVLFNESNAAIDYTVTVGTQATDGTIPSQAIQTLLWE